MGIIDQESREILLLTLIIISSFTLILGLEIQEGSALRRDKQDEDPKRNSSEESSRRSLKGIFQSCLSSSEEKESQINCSVSSSANFEEDFDTECLSPGVLRFLGEFDVLSVNCVAPFHLDFDFDGFKPTEAIKVNFWKELSSNATHRRLTPSAYHLDLKIYSNAALYKLHLNQVSPAGEGLNNTQNNQSTVPKLEYPRTGRYIIREIVSEEPRLEIYLFFEEPDQDPSFMLNNYTTTSVLGNGNLSVPCRPSHAGLPVNLYKMVNNSLVQIENPDFEPWKGFEIPFEEPKPGVIDDYICKFEIDEYSSIKFTYPSSK
ncbi:unnamed protein product [Allacma fusca]|uniref:Uncharacterized protein n=1 Tax=Allacma fusca TaxID=39272 RepID=A0A8J2KWV1_9HEXA|nr:unnamed protein product [Allacma fusca]